MIWRTTLCRLLGLVLGSAGLLWVPTTLAQEPPEPDPVEPESRLEEEPPLPDQPTDTQAALEQLLKLRDQMQREQEEKERSGHVEPKPTPQRATPPARRPTATSRPTLPPPAKSGELSLEERKARALASTQRSGANGRGEPPTVPADFVGPPESLAGPAATAPAPHAEVPEPETPEEPEKLTRRPSTEDDGEWFNFNGMPWEDVLAYFVQRIGKPLLDEGTVVIGGELTYVSDRKFTKQEALDELNLILHEKGYRFVEEEYHVYIVPLSEMPQHVDLQLVFPTVDAFERANPRDMEYVTVYYQVKDRSAQTIVDAFGDTLPDYTRLTAMADSNQIKIVALARDVRRFMVLQERIDIAPNDPREMRIFEIKTNAMDIEQRVRAFLNIGGAQQVPQIRMVPDPRTGRPVAQPVAAPAASGSTEVQMVADERTNTIIVKAMPDQFAQIKMLIDTLDIKPEIGEFKTVVVEILHADATEVANLLNQILQQEQGQQRTPNWQMQQQIRQQMLMQQRNRRPGQPVPPVQPTPAVQAGGVSPEEIFTEGIFERAKKTIRLVADTRTNSLIVYANDDGLKRVRELLETIDKPLPDTYQTFTLQYAKVADVTNLVTQIAQGMSQTGGRAGRSATIVPDEVSNTFHVIADREEMERVGRLIQQLDLPSPELERHVVELKQLRPSQVAQMVQALLGAGGSPAVTPLPGGRGRMPGMSRSTAAQSSTYQVIPLDEAQILIVLCMPEDWAKIEDTIKMWDENVVSNTPELETFPITKGNAANIAATLANFYRQYEHPVLGRSTVAIQAEGDSVMVFAIKPAREEIGALIRTLDVEDATDKVEILPLVNADAAQIAQQLQSLFMPRGPRGGGTAPLIMVESVTNSLIVQAERADMDKIKNFALEIDQKIALQSTERRFYTMQYAQPAEVAAAVQNIFGGRPAGRGAAAAAQIRALAAGAQVIVEAPKDKFATIEGFIKELDDPKGNEIKVVTLDVPGADVNQVAQNLTAAIRPLQRPGRPAASFIPDPTSDRVIVTATTDLLPKITELAAQLTTGVEEVLPVTITPKYADPNQLAQMIQAMFRPLGGRSAQQEVQVSVSNGMLVLRAPKKKLEQIEELVAAVDSQDTTGVQVKTYDLKVLNALQVQAQVQLFLAQLKKNVKAGQLAPGAFAEPTTNTLVVLAPPDVMPVLDGLIQELEGKTPPTGKVESYTLKFVRADQVANNIDAMLKAKVAEREGVKKTTLQTAVFSDATGNRLFVFAPDEYQELAAKLVEMVDAEPVSGDIVHIITLENADATQMAQSLTQVVAGRTGGAAGRGGTANVRIAADAGSNAVILAGMAKDLAEVEQWITELDGQSVRVPELQTFKLKHANATDVEETLKQLFPAGGRNVGDAVTVTADDYSGKLIVTANKRKMRQVETYIAELDRAPAEGEEDWLTGGRQIYLVDINRGSASDIAWDVRDLLPDEDRGGPSIESDWFDEYLIVKCRPTEFPQIEKLIRQFESRAKPELVVRTYRPRGSTDQAALVQWLKARGEEVEIVEPAAKPTLPPIVRDVWEDGEEPEAVKERREKQEREKHERGGRKASSFQSALPLSDILLDEIEAEIGGDQPPSGRVTRRWAPESDDALTVVPAAYQEPPAKAPTTAPQVTPGEVTDAGSYGQRVESPFEKTQVKLIPQPDGSFLVTGPRDKVDDITKALDVLQEDLAVGEVIRIFRFKYGDVTAAAEILSMMFDVQQRQIVIQQPQQPQRGQQGQQGRPGEDGRNQQQGMFDQLRGMVGGQQQGGKAGRGGQMRIATDPGHNYLIVKCDEADIPEIHRLLRELDIPPGEVQVKVFQLKNLNAEETCENIKDVLGISKVQQRRSGLPAGARGRGAMQPGGQQAQLLEMLQQQLVSVPGVEGGAKVERVEIVPNGVTNSLLVSSPPEVMELIERVIGELEELEGRDIVGIHYFPLQKARVDDVLPLLEEVFEAVSGGGGGGGGGRLRGMPGGGGGGSPAALGPVKVSADPRTNTIIFMAENKDVPAVEAHIKALDIEGPVAESEMYVCQYGDAEAIVSALEPIFGGGEGVGRGRRGGGAATGSAGTDVRLVAEPATNTILVWGPRDKRDVIFQKIEALDKLVQREIREIPVRFADAAKLADKLWEVFGDGAGGQAARQGGRRARQAAAGGTGAMSSGRVMILGDKAAKKLLVRAPDQIFTQIEDLAVTLDQPSADMQLKRFQLKYADATTVVESVKQALTEYLQLAKAQGDETDIEAFTAVPDPRTNSITVVGSDKTFLFVGEVLAAVDVETPADQKKEFRIFMLEKADAVTVAEAINGYATGGADTGGGQRGGRRGGGGGAAAAGARELNVLAVAEEATNSVMVIGRREDIDVVESTVINKLEDSLSDRYRIETVAVQNVSPSEIVNFIWQFIDQGAAAERGGQGGGRGGAKGAESAGPQIVPNDSAKTLVVRGTKRQIDDVRELVTRFDDKAIVQANIEVIQVPYGQDAARLATEVERIVNENERSDADRTGRYARQVTVGSDEYTNSLIVGGERTLFAQVKTIVDQLGEIRSPNVVTQVIQLRNLSAQDAQKVIDEMQKNAPAGGRSGTTGARRSGAGSRSPSVSPPSGGGQRQQRSTTPRQGGTRRSSGGGGAVLPTPELDLDRAPLMPKSLAWVEPYIALTPISSWIRFVLADDVFGDTQDEPPPRPRRQPPTTRPATEPLPESPPAARAQVLDEVEAELAGTQPAEEAQPFSDDLSGVTGALRGEVAANALDSQRIMITGDAADVEFIARILSMMEQTSAVALVQVFTLQEAKAATLAPIIDKSVKAWIDARTSQPGPQDKFSVNAEARSNSLIVSAAEPIMEKIAELVERLDVKKGGGGTEVKMLALQHIRAAEAAAILRPTIERYNTMNDVPKESQASIDPIDRDNSVMIIGTPKDISEIEGWLKALDVELTEEQKDSGFVSTDAILVQLKNGQAEDVAKVINEMIKAELEAAQSGGGDKKTAGKPFVKKIRLRLGEQEFSELDLERPIRLIAEKGTNSLLVFSSKQNNVALSEMITVFDALPIGAETDVKAFVLKHAKAESIATLLEETFKDKSYLNRPTEGDGKGLQKGVMPPVPPGVAAKGLPYPLVVQHDVRSNTVLVIGRKDAVLLAGGLVTELDRPTLEVGMKPFVVQLKNAQAAPLEEKLKKLLDDRMKALGGDKDAGRDTAVIYSDERSNKLIVLATEDVYDMVEDLVLQLDASDKYGIVDIRYRRLQHADAVKLQNMLEETFKSRLDADKKINKDATDSLTILADTRSNSLLLTGTRDYLQDAEQLINDLDRQFDGTVVFHARKVKLNSAPNIASLLKEMVEKALTQKDTKLSGTPIHVAADPVSDSLLLAAAREDMEILERWVDILDRPSEVGRNIKIIPLRRAVAEEVSKNVQDIFKKQGGSQTGGEIDVTVTADKTTNSVVAFGPATLLNDIETFVRQLDDTTSLKGTVVRIFKLQQAAAEDAGDLLGRVLELRGGTVGGTGGSGGGGSGSTKEDAKQVMLIFQKQHPDLGLETLRAVRSDIVVIADARTNSLVVTAPPESMPLMESLVAAVDVPPQDAKIRVFRLRNADAESLVKNLEALFQRRATGGTGRGGTAESERVLTVGEGLGGEGGRQEIAFATDVRTNSVIAAGTPGYLDLAEKLILELDTTEIPNRLTHVYSPKSIKAEELAPTIKEFSDAEQQRLQDIGQDVSIGVKQERQVTAIASKDANRVILDYDPRFQDTVMNVVRELDQPPPQVLIQVLIVEVTMDNALDLGVEFAFQDLQWTKAGPNDTTTYDYVGGTDLGAAGSGLGGFSFTITGADFNFLFRTLQNEGSLNVLSRPQIIAMDNQEALIEVTNDVPYVTGTSTTTGGQITTSVARENIGIKLTVTPQINPDGFVRMEIDQEVSDFTGSTVDVGQGVTAPVFFRRQAKTNVMVKDNETVVLGGLITSRTENREQKIPLLGDIPGLGLLFRNQNDTANRTELLLVMTPHVVRTVEDYRALSVTERDNMEVIPTETLTDTLMQGLRVEPEPVLPPARAAEDAVPVIRRETPAAQPVEGEYGPVRPTLRPEPTPQKVNEDSYDVPVSMRTR
ncbi:MAG: hypothetical protein KA383_00515 [Phycisphaerae bacterium]|nr:hypothetical protein [Phycisphaerae bacterium]